MARRHVSRGTLVVGSEAHFQGQVLTLAQVHGWLRYHTHNSQRSAPGFPDLVLVRGPRLLFVELKTQTGIISKAQADWIDALSTVATAVDGAVQRAQDGGHGPLLEGEPIVAAFIWRPSDWPEIEAVLAR